MYLLPVLAALVLGLLSPCARPRSRSSAARVHLHLCAQAAQALEPLCTMVRLPMRPRWVLPWEISKTPRQGHCLIFNSPPFCVLSQVLYVRLHVGSLVHQHSTTSMLVFNPTDGTSDGSLEEGQEPQRLHAKKTIARAIHTITTSTIPLAFEKCPLISLLLKLLYFPKI